MRTPYRRSIAALLLAWGSALACGPSPAGTGGDTGMGTSSSNPMTQGPSPETTQSTSSSATTGDASSSTTAAPSTTTEVTTGTATNDVTTDDCDFVCTDTDPCDGVSGDSDARCQSSCDPLAQDCPEGEKCVAYDSDGDAVWDALKCAPVTGAGQHGEPCEADGPATGDDDCGAGVMCWHLDDDLQGTCVALCTGTYDEPTCAPPNTDCYIANGGVIALCVTSCDPVAQDCSVGQVCVSNGSDGFVCSVDTGHPSPPGTPCEWINACDTGSFCANPEFAPAPDCEDALGCCSAYCDLGAGDGPCQAQNPEFVCVPWFEEGQAPAELEHVGGCGLPQ